MVVAILLFLESIGTGELMVVMLFALLFFGSEKIPDLARGLGKGMRQVKDAMNGVQSEITQGMREVERNVNDVSEELPKIESNPLSKPFSTAVTDTTGSQLKSDDALPPVEINTTITTNIVSTEKENPSSETPKAE